MQGCTVFLLLSCVWLFATPWTGSCQTPLSSTISLSLLKLSPLSWWCHLNILFSAAHFSFCLKSFPATREDGGVEGCALIFSCVRIPNCNLLLNNRQQENVGSHQKKILHIQRQRRSPNKTVGRAKSCLESDSIPTRDAWRAQTKPCVH